MKRMTGILFASLLAVGCSSTSMTSSEIAGGGGAELKGKEPTHYRLLADPVSIREIDYGRPLTKLHVKGYMTQRGFVPLSKVEGSGKLCEGGTDWVSLSDGTFHAAGSGETKGPHVMGCKGKSGAFLPASKDVISE